MMTGKDDDAANSREDSFLAELVPQAAEHLAGQHAGDYDAEDGRSRFQTWLEAHTERPAAIPIERSPLSGSTTHQLRNQPAHRDVAEAAQTFRAHAAKGRAQPADNDLTTRAAEGDRAAWNELIDRYTPLILTICHQYRLSNHDIEDISQIMWLLLVEQLGKLREPTPLPKWLATTTARECIRVVTAGGSFEWLETKLDDALQHVDDAVIDEWILMAARNAAVRAAFAELPPRCQQLLSMLLSDPPHSYAEIHAELGIPVDSIGPQRARCLNRLRRSITLITPSESESKTKINTLGAGQDPLGAGQKWDDWDDEQLLAVLLESV
jgi:RNA polymerase sigma factor (sigma-70 family)